MVDDFMQGYTRSPEQTEKLLGLLRAALYANPTQRLGQFLTNIADRSDLFNVHDEVIMKRILADLNGRIEQGA